MYDLIIIGGGPGGYMAAERAGGAGLKVLLIEERALGGVCLNEGCIPSKALLHSAKTYEYAKSGFDNCIEISKPPKLNQEAVIKRKNEVVNKLVSGVKALMKANKVKVITGKAHIVNTTTVEVGDETYTGSRLLIATGSVPIIPNFDGVKVGLMSGFLMTNREILDLESIPTSLVVIGGGVVGLEMASYFNSAGAKVTVIEMQDKIAGAMDTEISTLLMNSYKEKGIEFILNARVTQVKDRTVFYERLSDASPALIKADKVLLSIGRKPQIEDFGLENTGVLVENGAITTDSNGLTNIPNIYAVGDVNGKYMLAHAAYREAEVAVAHMLGKRDTMRYDAVPTVIYTSPEVASVGETEESAKLRGLDTASVTVPMMYSGRYVAENTATDGICKVVIDKNQRNIIGVHLYGSYASEIITSACMMIEMQMRVEDVQKYIFPHPTVSEILREAVFKL